MKKTFRKRIMSTLALATAFSISAGGLASVEAEGIVYPNTSPTIQNGESNDLIGEISNVFIKDGCIYIDLLEEYSSTARYIFYTSNIGKCPSKTKVKTVKKTRAQLITLRNRLEGENNIGSFIIGFLIPGWAGNVASVLAGVDGITLTAVKKALDTTKSNFTVTSKWQCEEINFGIRGIVHRYKLQYVSIQ